MEADEVAELSSACSSDPPIFSDLLLTALYPEKKTIKDIVNIQTCTKCTSDLYLMIMTYLVFIKISNDNAHKQRETDHAAQKHEDVNIDAMSLQTETININKGPVQQYSGHRCNFFTHFGIIILHLSRSEHTHIDIRRQY